MLFDVYVRELLNIRHDLYLIMQKYDAIFLISRRNGVDLSERGHKLFPILKT